MTMTTTHTWKRDWPEASISTITKCRKNSVYFPFLFRCVFCGDCDTMRALYVQCVSALAQNIQPITTLLLKAGRIRRMKNEKKEKFHGLCVCRCTMCILLKSKLKEWIYLYDIVFHLLCAGESFHVGPTKHIWFASPIFHYFRSYSSRFSSYNNTTHRFIASLCFVLFYFLSIFPVLSSLGELNSIFSLPLVGHGKCNLHIRI